MRDVWDDGPTVWDEPALPYAGTSGWSGTDTSRDRAIRRDGDGSTANLQTRLVVLVAQTGPDGLTVADARRILYPDHHGSISGPLSNLHAVGRIARLEGRRDGCHPYVLPQYVHGRRTEQQGRDEMPNANRRAGDYLERQTKAALAAQGWWVIRAAGSFGEADIVALRTGMASMLISCKVDGRIGPKERTELIDAATRAGARPIMASRAKRGYIDLGLVHADGVASWSRLRAAGRPT